ncbi:hypothetical protein [Bacillus bombysepticus]|uniref:hypothetical protein n=1 Tax=Bacillus bombysepticus TaxID=658666 RepID=UPI00301967AE
MITLKKLKKEYAAGKGADWVSKLVMPIAKCAETEFNMKSNIDVIENGAEKRATIYMETIKGGHATKRAPKKLTLILDNVNTGALAYDESYKKNLGEVTEFVLPNRMNEILSLFSVEFTDEYAKEFVKQNAFKNSHSHSGYILMDRDKNGNELIGERDENGNVYFYISFKGRGKSFNYMSFNEIYNVLKKKSNLKVREF